MFYFLRSYNEAVKEELPKMIIIFCLESSRRSSNDINRLAEKGLWPIPNFLGAKLCLLLLHIFVFNLS